MLVIEREADKRKRAGVLDVEEIRKGKERTTQQGNRPVVCGEGKNRPRETPGRCEIRTSAFKVVDRALHHWVLWPITECQKRDRRVVRVRSNGGSVDDTVSRIPSATGAGTIHKHLDPTIHPRGGQLETAARTRQLV